MTAPSPTSITVNRRTYRLPSRPVVVVCLAGTSDAYLDAALVRGRMPNLQRWCVDGFRGLARAALPSVTHVNNVSIVTGVSPGAHGICGNFFYDPVAKEEVMMNSGRQVRCDTLLAAAARAGRRVAVVTAKESLRELVGHGLVGPPPRGAQGIVFSCEKASQARPETHGVGGVESLAGGLAPPISSAEASLYVLRAGAALLERGLADLLYLSTTGYVAHRHPPEAPEAVDFYAAVDEALGRLQSLGAAVGVTADHGMNAKHSPEGVPNVIYLESLLTRQFGVGFRVILPITDPYRAQHGGLGSFAVVHLPSLQPPDPIIQWLLELPGISEVYDRRTAARQLELPPDRLGELVVMSERNVVLGRTPEHHDLRALEGRLRSHGGRYEQMVPLVVSERLSPGAAVLASGDLRNFDVFDLVLNSTG